jgi:hypothetical protein
VENKTKMILKEDDDDDEDADYDAIGIIDLTVC